METTVTIEFASETKQHLKTLEHQLKHIGNVKVDLVEPRVHTAPVLIAIDMHKGGEQAAQDVARALHSFLHEDTGAQGEKKISLVTIEGDRIDIEPLTVEEIRRIIVGAEEG